MKSLLRLIQEVFTTAKLPANYTKDPGKIVQLPAVAGFTWHPPAEGTFLVFNIRKPVSRKANLAVDPPDFLKNGRFKLPPLSLKDIQAVRSDDRPTVEFHASQTGQLTEPLEYPTQILSAS